METFFVEFASAIISLLGIVILIGTCISIFNDR